MGRKYFHLFKLYFIETLKNKNSLVGLSIFLITCLIIFSNLWKIAAGRMNAFDLNPDSLLWYIALNESVLISLPDIQEDIEDDLKSGKLSYLLPRPISYIGSKFFEGLGILSANLLVLGIVAFCFTAYMTGKIPPGFLLILPLGILSGCVALIFHLLIGISAFWMHEVGPFYWLFEKLLFIFGGLMLPLFVYPKWIQTLASFTPFPAILGERSALAIDFQLSNVLHLVATLSLWAIIGICSLFFLYRKGLKILTIGGG
jgi:ABC-2 type transport system permease protein